MEEPIPRATKKVFIRLPLLDSRYGITGAGSYNDDQLHGLGWVLKVGCHCAISSGPQRSEECVNDTIQDAVFPFDSKPRGYHVRIVKYTFGEPNFGTKSILTHMSERKETISPYVCTYTISYLQYLYIYICVYMNIPVGVSVNGTVRYSQKSANCLTLIM